MSYTNKFYCLLNFQEEGLGMGFAVIYKYVLLSAFLNSFWQFNESRVYYSDDTNVH